MLIRAGHYPHFYAGVNLKKKVHPLIKERLKLSDTKVIDPIVDITNYVLLELGQPLHAFDAKKLEGNLQVRFAKEKEKITLSEARAGGVKFGYVAI